MAQDELLEQLYGILDDWKAQRFGGEPIVEAIDNLRVMAATTPGTAAELKKITAALEKLAAAVAAQPAAGGDSASELKRIARRLERLGDKPTAEDATEKAREEIADNFAEIADRMGRRPDTGSLPMELTARTKASLNEANPIAPSAVFADGDASIYGIGLDGVREIRVDGSPAPIRRRTAREVEFTVPAHVGPGTVGVEVVLADGTVLMQAVEVVDDGSTVTQKAKRKASAKGVSN